MATAKEKRPFQIILDDVPNPKDYSAAGSHVERAGQLQGQAEATEGAGKAQFIGDVVGIGAKVGVAAATGAVKSDTRDALSKFEDSPENVRGRNASEAIAGYDQALGNQEEDITRPDPQHDPQVDMLRAEANKYRLAEQQGLLTKDEVLTRVAASVKTWSARFPGLQSEFRQAAANETGISNIDVYQIHKALTTQSEREKRQEQVNKYILDFQKQVADYHGKPINAVTQGDMERFHIFRQLETQQKSLEVGSKVATLADEQKARLLDNQISLEHSKNLVRLSSLFNDWDQANNDVSPAGAKRRDEISRQLGGMIDGMGVQMEAYIRHEFRASGVAMPETERRVKEQRETYKNLSDLMKNKEGRDAMRQVIGRAKDTAADMQARFQIAFPALEAWGRTGVAADMMRLALDPSGHKTLERLLGKDAAQKWIEMPQKMIQFEADMMKRIYDPTRVDQHGQLDLRGPEAAAYDPKAQQVAVDIAITKLTLIPDRKDQDPKYFGEYGVAAHVLSNAIAANVTATTERFNNVMDIPATVQYFANVPAIKRQAIAAPIYNRLATPVRDDVSEVSGLLAEYNSAPDNQGRTMSIKQDASGKLVVTKTGAGPAPGTIVTEGITPSFSILRRTGQEGVKEGEVARSVEGQINQRIGRINTNLKAIGKANYISTLTNDNTHYQLGAQVVSALDTGGRIGPLTPAEQAAVDKQAGAPKPTKVEEYTVARDKFLEKHEGVRDTVYPDSSVEKHPTIGVGFKLNRSDLPTVLKNVLGWEPDKVLALQKGEQKLSKPEIVKLYNFSVKEAEDVVEEKLGDVALTDTQRVVATSLAFNGGSGLVGERFVSALKSGDIQGAINEVLYYSGTPKNPKLANRRHAEAALLAEEAGLEIVKLPEYVKMVNKQYVRKPETKSKPIKRVQVD